MASGGARATARAWWAPAWLRAGHGLRAGWAANLALAVLVGLSGGVVMAAVAGARRTDSAVSRFVEYHRPAEVNVEAPDAERLQAVLRLPQVADSGSYAYVDLAMSPEGGTGRLTPFVANDDHQYRTFDRILVVRGRMPEADEPFEVVVNEKIATRHHLRVGSRFRMYSSSLEQARATAADLGTDRGPPAGPVLDLRVAGVGRVPTDIRETNEFDEIAWFTPAFLQAYAARLGISVDEAIGIWIPPHSRGVRLHRPADVAAFSAAARAIVGPDGRVEAEVSDATIAADAAERSVRLQALALLAFAALGAVTTLLIVGQAIARQVGLDAADDDTLRAMGMGRGQLVAAAACRNGVVAGIGTLLGLVVAVAASPGFPLGLARRAEIDPGPALDLAVLVPGALLMLVVVPARGALAAWLRGRRSKSATSASRSPHLADRLHRLGAPPPMLAGVRSALEPSGPARAATARGAVAAALAAVTGVLAALMFVNSLDHLTGDPRRQGWNWDVLIGNDNTVGNPEDLQARLVAHPDVGAAMGMALAAGVRVDGRGVNTIVVNAVALDDVKGRVEPTVLEGRAPTGPDDVALASATLADLGHRVGDMVAVDAGAGRHNMRISGRIVFPTAGNWFGASLNRGAVITLAAARGLDAQVEPARLFGVRLAAGRVPGATIRLRAEFGALVAGPTPPQDLVNLRRVAWMPLALAMLLVVVGGGTTAHTLVTSVRRRRRELAVLKTLGFVRRQVAATVAWQASALVGVALVVGLPLGVAAGRWSWSLVAGGTGTFSPPVVPVPAMVAVVPVTLVAANLVAAVPGWMAGRLRPAVVLRTE